jgi:hypothetical protein
MLLMVRLYHYKYTLAKIDEAFYTCGYGLLDHFIQLFWIISYVPRI